MIQTLFKPSRREFRWFALIVVIVTFILFGNSLNGGFVYDDQPVIFLHDQLRSISNIPHLFLEPFLFNQPEAGLYRPLTATSYAINFVFGESAFSFHLVNILLHAVTTLLLWLLLWQLFKNRWLAYVASIIFMVLAIHTEAIANIIGRAEILAWLFGLGCLLGVINKRFVWAAIMFLLAVFSKESAAAIAPLVVWQLWVRGERSWKKFVINLWPFVIAGLIYIVLRYIALEGHLVSVDASYAYNPLVFSSGLVRFATAFKVMLLLIFKTFFPIHLSADYSYNQIKLVHSLFSPYILAGLIVLVTAVSMALYSKTRITIWGWASAAFVLLYFIVSNFVFAIGTIMAERTMYAPSAALAVFLAGVFFKIYTQGRWGHYLAYIALVIFVIFQTLVTVNRNPVWASEAKLFENMVQTAPDSVHAQTEWAQTLFKLGRWSEGRLAMQRAIEIYPEHLPLLFTQAVIATHDGHLAEAEQLYLKILNMRSAHMATRWKLGTLYFNAGEYSVAVPQFKYLYDRMPKIKYAMYYAASLELSGQSSEAISFIEQKYGSRPDNDALRAILGYAYLSMGKTKESKELLKTVGDALGALKREAGNTDLP